MYVFQAHHNPALASLSHGGCRRDPHSYTVERTTLLQIAIPRHDSTRLVHDSRRRYAWPGHGVFSRARSLTLVESGSERQRPPEAVRCIGLTDHKRRLLPSRPWFRGCCETRHFGAARRLDPWPRAVCLSRVDCWSGSAQSRRG